MIDERLDELACLHALGLLEGAELEPFLAQVGADPALRARVSELRAVSATLALAAPSAEPPPQLRARVLASAAATRRAGPAPGSVSVFPWMPWLAAASFAAAVWYGAHYYEARRLVLSLQDQQAAAQLAMDRARAELGQARRDLDASARRIAALDERLRTEGDLAHFKISTLASMLGNTPEAMAVAVWDPSREQGVLSVSKLPALAKEKDYQLWIIDTQYPNPVNGGVFAVDPATGEAHIVFKGDKPIKSVAKFAVSLERKGGVPKAEGPIVLLGP